MQLKRSIWVTWQAEGTHHYPLAETDSNLRDVAFLAFEHRHMFHFKVEIEVFADDREIEFIQFKRKMEDVYGGPMYWGAMSCEMIATEILEWVNKLYPGRDILVTVSEDGENGASVYYDKRTEENLKKYHAVAFSPDPAAAAFQSGFVLDDPPPESER